MSFDLRTFISKGLKDAVGKMPDYKIILNATGWFEKGVLAEGDLEELNALIDAKNNVLESEELTESVEGSGNT